MNTQTTMTIIRKDGVLSSISLVMPVWLKMDGLFSIDLPFFNIKTFAKNEAEIDIAIEEAVKSFCLAAEKFGKGLENELSELGWNKSLDNSIDFTLPHNEVIEQMVETGKMFAINNLSIAA